MLLLHTNPTVKTQAFANGMDSQSPVDGTIARGQVPYDYPDTNEGYEAAKKRIEITFVCT